jgi:hypothetical protein
MPTLSLEERVTILEQEILALKRQLRQPAVVPWWEQINGAFADTPAFDEVFDFGRQYRESQSPKERK